MDFKELEQNIPQTKPDIQIGPLFIWIKEKVVEDTNIDYIVLISPFLLKTEKVIAFSPNSDIKGFELKNFKKDLEEMYANAGKENVVECQFEESEFGIKLKSNTQGHIEVTVLYRGWDIPDCGRLEFTNKIDQSYLPAMIESIDKVISKYL